MRQEHLGDSHTANTLSSMAAYYLVKGELKAAIEYCGRANEVRGRWLQCNLQAGSERQKLALLSFLARDIDITTLLSILYAPEDMEARRAALLLLLKRKGRVLDALADSISILRSRSDSQDQKLLDELAAVRAELAELTLTGRGKQSVEKYREKVTKLEERQEELENTVAVRSNAAAMLLKRPEVTLESVARMLPEGGALIEFVRFLPYRSQERRQTTARYAAFVLTSKGELAASDLGEAAQIEQWVTEFRDSLRTSNSSISSLLARGRRLYDAVMRPLMKSISGCHRLYISPDAALNLIPFEALVDSNGKYLVESYEISYLTSGRDLLRQQRVAESGAPVIIANPDYVTDYGATIGEVTTKPLLELPGTEEEARAIAQLYKDVEVYTGRKATEEVIKSLHQPKFLHIATHGLFLADSAPAPEVAARNLVNIDMGVSSASTNPLLRSFLFFSKANGKSGEDGVLTALEAAGLNLWGTRIVAMSACDTGVGEVKSTEGIYGLRRAFLLAGSETQLMSL